MKGRKRREDTYKIRKDLEGRINYNTNKKKIQKQG